jgi:hypothetical protein
MTSLSRPEGNSIGVTALSVELSGKRIELIKEALPDAGLVAAIPTTLVQGRLEQWASEAAAPRARPSIIS